MADKLTRQLLKAVDEMQDLAPGTTADARSAPTSVHTRTPWSMVVRFSFPGGATYDDLFPVLRDWRDDRRIERAVGGDRLARIQVRYRNKKGRGSKGEYTIAEIGPWELAVSRAMERVGIRDNKHDAIIARYGAESDSPSVVEAILVWFSSATSSEVRMGKPQARVPVKKRPTAKRPAKKSTKKPAPKKVAPAKKKKKGKR